MKSGKAFKFKRSLASIASSTFCSTDFFFSCCFLTLLLLYPPPRFCSLSNASAFNCSAVLRANPPLTICVNDGPL